MKKKYFIYAITVIYVISVIFLLRTLIGRNTFNKARIIQFVLDNEELLNQAIEEIRSLDNSIHVVAHTRFRSRPNINFEGLYTSGTANGQNVIEPLDNPILYELITNGRIRSIGISRPSPDDRMSTHQIQFAFNVRGFWDRYGGIYFSRNDVPILFNGRMWGNPEAYMDGWVSYGTNFYYTERILPHWFYYEMVFNSNRTPNR